jgi:hypothetical protein
MAAIVLAAKLPPVKFTEKSEWSGWASAKPCDLINRQLLPGFCGFDSRPLRSMSDSITFFLRMTGERKEKI